MIIEIFLFFSYESEFSHSSTQRPNYRSNNSPKSRLRQHDNLTNPFDNSSKDNESSSQKLPNGNANRQTHSPTFTNGSGTTSNGGNSKTSSSSSSSSFSLRPKQTYNPRAP